MTTERMTPADTRVADDQLEELAAFHEDPIRGSAPFHFSVASAIRELQRLRSPGGASEKCPACGTVVMVAPGIGPYCPNMACSIIDNLRPDANPALHAAAPLAPAPGTTGYATTYLGARRLVEGTNPAGSQQPSKLHDVGSNPTERATTCGCVKECDPSSLQADEVCVNTMQRPSPEPSVKLPPNVTRYKVVQDKGEYCLKGCPDGDLVDFSAYAALLAKSSGEPGGQQT